MRAANLFYSDGIRAVGVNRLLEEAQTPIMSLYRQFGSKEGLVEAFLIDKDQRVRAKFEREVERLADSGRDKMLAVFDVLGAVVDDPDYRGCTFINVAVEMANPQHPFVDVSIAHKRETRELFATYLREAGVAEPEPLAAQMLMLVDGVFVASQMQAPYEAAQQARVAAEILLDNALRKSASVPVAGA